MNEIQPFQFRETEIQTIAGESGPEFRAAHICKAIGVNNARQAVRRVSDDCKGVRTVTTPGGPQRAWFLTEAGVWELITSARLRRDSPEAERIIDFRRYLTGIILPAIRRTGQWVPAPAKAEPPKLSAIVDEVEATIRVARLFGFTESQAIISTRNRILRVSGVDLQAEIGLALAAPENKVQRTATQVGEAIAARTGEKWSAVRVNRELIARGWQVKHPDGKHYEATPRSVGGLLLDTGKSHGGGKPVQMLVWVGDEVVDFLSGGGS